MGVDRACGKSGKFGAYIASGGIFGGGVDGGVLRMEKMAGFGWREMGRDLGMGKGGGGDFLGDVEEKN